MHQNEPAPGHQAPKLSLAHADLVARVVDWKGHNVSSFGELLQFDVVWVRQVDESGKRRWSKVQN
jgi:hypothetical protein